MAPLHWQPQLCHVRPFIPVSSGFLEEGLECVFGCALYLADLLCVSSSMSGWSGTSSDYCLLQQTGCVDTKLWLRLEVLTTGATGIY